MVTLVAIALLASTGLAHGFLSGFQGGSVQSPNGQWTISARGADMNGEEMTTVATLTDRRGRRRPLLRFERDLEVVWLPGTRQALLIQRTIHFATLHLFELRRAGEVGAIQSDLERHMRRLHPGIGEIENRQIVLGHVDSDACILVEESGLPRGRSTGSFVARRTYFRLDLVRGRAAPTNRCRGVAIA